ncbi:MAG: fibronectin type III domain-containing protein [Chitinophagaceae bacterium]
MTVLDAATYYEVYRSANNNSNYLLLTKLPMGTTSYVDTGLFANAVYYYKVRAVNVDAGPSGYSNEDSALTRNHRR